LSEKLKVSIVVLCYNALEEATRPCLESVLANTLLGTYELIVIDNASTDETANYLKELASNNSHVIIKLNNKNKGYAGGNNDGLRLATGQFVILLNNDTLVSSGWMDALIRLFKEDQSIGLIGPVTNSAGNEQLIELDGLNEVNFSIVAKNYTEKNKYNWFTTDKLGFFCVAMRRNLIEQIGLLDEKFGIGMFEDDDFCIRVKNAGYSIAVIEDCFVYHKGSVSFKKLTKSDYIEIFNRNRNYFYEKHGLLWTYSDITNAIWDKIKSDLLLIKKTEEDNNIQRILVRINNMTNSIFQLREIEKNSVDLDGSSYVHVQLVEKQSQLMEISDWASSLNLEKQQLEKQISELKVEKEDLLSSRLFPLFKFFQQKGI
jgi:GT2 family glycosyltransferase